MKSSQKSKVGKRRALNHLKSEIEEINNIENPQLAFANLQMLDYRDYDQLQENSIGQQKQEVQSEAALEEVKKERHNSQEAEYDQAQLVRPSEEEDDIEAYCKMKQKDKQKLRELIKAAMEAIVLPADCAGAKKDFLLKYQIELQINNIKKLNQALEQTKQAYQLLQNEENDVLRQFDLA